MFNNIRTAQKAQLRKCGNSSENVHLSFERQNVLLSAILLVCVICSSLGLWVKWNNQIKVKNHCISFRASCAETSAGRRAVVSSHYSPFLTPWICPADMLLVAVAIFLASSSSWYSSVILLSLALLPLVSLISFRLFALLTLAFPFSADPLLPGGFLYLTPLDSGTLHLSFAEPFSMKTSRCPLTKPVPLPAGWERWHLSSSHGDSWTVETLARSAFASASWYQHECSANPDGEVTRLECIYYVNCF